MRPLPPILVAVVAAVLCSAVTSAQQPAPTRGVADWVKDLDSTNPLVREEALELLARSRAAAKEAVPRLKGLLKDPSPLVRLRAAIALIRIEGKSDEALLALNEAARNSGPFERLLALETALPVADNQPATVELLTAALADKDFQARARIEVLLTRLGPLAVPALLKMAGHADEEIVRTALRNLERIGADAETIGPTLRPLLKDKPVAIRSLALSCLLRGRADPQPLLPVIDDILKQKDPEAGPRVYTAILEPPGVRSKSLIPILESALAGPNSYYRVRSATLLWEIDGRTKETIPVLVGALRQGIDAGSRNAALTALAKMGPAAADIVPAFMEVIRTEPMFVSVTSFAYIFNNWGDGAIEPLAKFLDDKDSRVRLLSMQALGQLSEKAAAHLVKVFEKADGTERLQMIQIFGTMRARAEPAVPALVEVLKKGSQQETYAAATALANIGPSAAAAIPQVAEMLKEARGSTGRGTPLYTLIGNVGPWAGKAVPVLIDIVKDERLPLGERQPALLALGNIGPGAKETVPELLKLAEKEKGYTKVLALCAAIQIDPREERVVKALTVLIADASPDVKPYLPNVVTATAPLGREAAAVTAALVESFKPRPQEAAVFVNALSRSPDLDETGERFLQGLLASPDGVLAASAAVALATHGVLDDSKLPALVEGVLLNVNDPRRFTLLRDLARHGPKARPLADVLVRCWEREQDVPTNRLAIADALTSADAAKAKPLTDWLKDQARHQDPSIAAPAWLCRWRIDPTNDAHDALRSMLGSSAPTRHAAAEALGKMGPTARAAVPDLEAALKAPEYAVRMQAALALWKIDSRSDKSQAALAEALKDRHQSNSSYRLGALAFIGARGKEAAALGPALLSAAARSDTAETKTFLQTIRRIDPDALKKIKAE